MVIRTAIFFGNRPTTVTGLHIKDISWDRWRLARRCPPRGYWHIIANRFSGEWPRFVKATISGCIRLLVHPGTMLGHAVQERLMQKIWPHPWPLFTMSCKRSR